MPATADLPAQMSIGDLDFAVRESEHRRTVGITIDRDGSLLLHAPTGSDPDAVASWAWSKRGWVFRKLAEKHLLLPAGPAKDFVTGEGFDYLGRHYRLQLTDDAAGTGVRLERGRLRMLRVHSRSRGRPKCDDPLVPAVRPHVAAASHRSVGGAHGPAPRRP